MYSQNWTKKGKFELVKINLFLGKNEVDCLYCRKARIRKKEKKKKEKRRIKGKKRTKEKRKKQKKINKRCTNDRWQDDRGRIDRIVLLAFYWLKASSEYKDRTPSHRIGAFNI